MSTMKNYRTLARAAVIDAARKAARGDIKEIRWLMSREAEDFLDLGAIDKSEAVRFAVNALLGERKKIPIRR